MQANTKPELLPIGDAIETVLGKRFHAVTVRRWRREKKLMGCVRVGKEYFCSLDSVREMVQRERENETSSC